VVGRPEKPCVILYLNIVTISVRFYFLRRQGRLKKNRVEFFVDIVKCVTHIAADQMFDAAPPAATLYWRLLLINVCRVDSDLVFHGDAGRVQR